MLELKEEFTHIYEETYKALFVYVIGKIRNIYDTDDVLQTIYMSLYRRLCNKGILPVDQALKILYTAARHEIGYYYGFVKYQRKMVPLFSEENTEMIEIQLMANSLFQSIDENGDQEILDCIWNFIHEKDELTYRAFLLHYLEGLSFKECANALNCSNATIVHRVYRTIQEIRELFKEDIAYDKDSI